MIQIDYPSPAFRMKEEAKGTVIFDSFRKRWVPLTPEEWVRQNFLQYLVQVKKYPVALIAVEREIMLGELRKRFDILVYDGGHQPWMMIECKAESVPLSDDVLHQVLRYNVALPVHYMVVTNGQFTAAFARGRGELRMLDHLPERDVLH